MRRTFFSLALLLALSAGAAFYAAPGLAQESPKDKKEQKKEKEKEKKQDKGGGSESGDLAADRKNLTRTLRAFADGFEGSTPRRVTELLDANFYDFPRFEDQVTQFIQQNAEMRIFLRESTSEVKGDKATLIVDADMTFADKSNPAAQKKRRERIQFDFVRTPKGWKIYEINPRSFFVP